MSNVIAIIARRDHQTTGGLASAFSLMGIEGGGSVARNITRMRIDHAESGGGPVVLTLTRIRMQEDGVTPILRGGPSGLEADTYEERYGLDSLFANGWLLADADNDIEGAPA